MTSPRPDFFCALANRIYLLIGRSINLPAQHDQPRLRGGGGRFTTVPLVQMPFFASSIGSWIGSAASRSSQASLKPLCPAGAKRLLGRAAVGAALMVSCLHAGAASVLSFNFSFTGGGFPSDPGTVTGIVDGLVDNLNDQKTGLTVTVTSATNSNSLPEVFTDTDYLLGSGFNVLNGQVTGANIRYFNSAILSTIDLANTNSPDLLYPRYEGNRPGYFINYDFDASPSNTLRFTPIGGPASVPGPLPLFGAGAAFDWSRRLRRKIKATTA